MSNTTVAKSQKLVYRLLERFAEMKGEAISRMQANSMGKDSYLSLDKNFAYGGYRLTRVNVDRGSHCGCYGIGDIDARMSNKVMEAYLKGLINSNNP